MLTKLPYLVSALSLILTKLLYWTTFLVLLNCPY